MKFLPTNTLAHFNGAPQVHLNDLSHLPVSVFSESTLKYRAMLKPLPNDGCVSPNDEAVTFYVLNHCASIVRKVFTPNEPLPEWARQIMSTYTDVTMAQGERMLHYILSITTREMRHLEGYAKAPDKYEQIELVAGPVMKAYVKKIVTMDESKAVQHYMNHPPNATVGQYIKAMSVGFWKAKWGNAVDLDDATGYGGPKWGKVADAASEMLHGNTSMEMLVDTGFTLAHNGGPIFNKGMMYTGYDPFFMTILDVQRAGELLELLDSANTYGVKKTVEAEKALALIKANYPVDAQGKSTLKGYVDWKLVDALRPESEKKNQAVKYHKQIAAQTQATAQVVATTKPKAEITTLLGKKIKVTGEWQVFPNQTVKVFERVAN